MKTIESESLARRCDDVSHELLHLIERTMSDMDPAAAATAIVMLSGKLQGRHGEDGFDASRAYDLWVKSWGQESVRRVFQSGFDIERSRRAVLSGGVGRG